MHVNTSKLQNGLFVNFCAINQIIDVRITLVKILSNCWKNTQGLYIYQLT